MKNLLKLTDAKTLDTIIIGASNIIEAKKRFIQEYGTDVTEIRSIGAMVTTNWVTETIEEITNQYNQHDK